MTRRISVHIEELVFHGSWPGDRHAIGASLGEAVGERLAALGMPASWTGADARAGIDAGRIEASPGGRPSDIARRIAAAIVPDDERSGG